MEETDQTVAILPKRSFFSGLLRSPDFIKLWTGQTISTLGSYISGDGLPLLAVITLKASPLQLGILSAVGSAPVLLFSLLAGIWVDRLRRRPILIAADLGRALILATIPLAAVMGWLNIWLIYVVIALVGILTVLFNSAYRAYLPSLVGPEAILEGNSRLALSESAAEVVGPGLTGLLVQTITAPVAILFDSLSFLASVLSLGLIRKPEPPPVPAEGRLPLIEEARAGLNAVLHQPVLRSLAGEAAMSSFFGNFIGVLYALYGIRVLHLSPAAIGLTIGVGGASSLVGALLVERLHLRIRLGRLLVGAFFAGHLFVFLLPLAGSFLSLGLAFLLIGQATDLFGSIYRISSLSLRQSITPAHLQGRVNASLELLTGGIGPLGALAGGLLASWLGVQATLFISAVGLTTGGLWLVLSPVRKLIDFNH